MFHVQASTRILTYLIKKSLPFGYENIILNTLKAEFLKSIHQWQFIKSQIDNHLVGILHKRLIFEEGEKNAANKHIMQMSWDSIAIYADGSKGDNNK